MKDVSAATMQLNGDWTIAGVGQQLSTISCLPFQEDTGTVAIDCSGIDQIDLSGLQLLHVWFHCIRLRGLQPSLCNVPDAMMTSLARLGMADNFTCDRSVTA